MSFVDKNNFTQNFYSLLFDEMMIFLRFILTSFMPSFYNFSLLFVFRYHFILFYNFLISLLYFIFNFE